MNKEEQRTYDLKILTQIYDGNHLNNDERERAFKLMYLMNNDLKNRVV